MTFQIKICPFTDKELDHMYSVLLCTYKEIMDTANMKDPNLNLRDQKVVRRWLREAGIQKRTRKECIFIRVHGG